MNTDAYPLFSLSKEYHLHWLKLCGLSRVCLQFILAGHIVFHIHNCMNATIQS